MSEWIVTGRCSEAPPAADWRERLTQMLGERPRRIGLWAELGLYGALRCMAEAGEQALPKEAVLMLASRGGTHVATRAALDQMQDDLPMPLTFLQTQPSQLLALLAARLAFPGNACFLAGAGLGEARALAERQAGRGGALVGWVDDAAGGATEWLRICRSD
ncbi:MAG: hypothetical protein HZC22_00170 [Rhodocyclales bacterium]|nr:hypothetical protein [Rhodocyclales bacterium]